MGWWKDSSAGRAYASLFSRSQPVEDIKPGSVFRCVHKDRMEETAKVLSINEDTYGIPHVHFLLSFRRPNRSLFDGGARMLALKSFADRYNEQISA